MVGCTRIRRKEGTLWQGQMRQRRPLTSCPCIPVSVVLHPGQLLPTEAANVGHLQNPLCIPQIPYKTTHKPSG